MLSLTLLSAQVVAKHIKYGKKELDSHSNKLVKIYINNKQNWDKVIIWASKKGYIDIIEYLYKAGVNIHTENNYKALIYAIENNHLDVVKFLVGECRDAKLLLAQAQNPAIHANDNHVLLLAVWKGHLEIVKYLIEAGDDVHVFNDFALQHARNDAALQWAAIYGHLEIVKYFNELIKFKKIEINPLN